MDIYVLDLNYNPIGVIDTFLSCIWTVRYDTYGDFELCLPASKESFQLLPLGAWLQRDDSDRLMRIEKIEAQTDTENGNYLIVSGRSAEAIIASRIVWNQTILIGNAEMCIRQLLDENIISPAIPSRKINNFALSPALSRRDTVSIQSTGDNLLDVITSICRLFGYGFKVVLENKRFVFKLFIGKDDGVTFSPEFDNLISSDFLMNMQGHSNVALVAGEGEGTERKTWVVGTDTGIDRFEMFVDARDISSNSDEISQSDYNKLLLQRGKEKLSETKIKISFDANVLPTETYKYKTDYDIGDVCYVENEYGIKAKSRIVEIIECEDATGFSVIPTFEEWSVI